VSDRDRLAELQQLAHDVRNALNGVAVNLEVARSRAQREASIAQVVPFLETAAQQLDAAARLHKRYSDIVSGVAADQAGRSMTDAVDRRPDDTHSRSEHP
jgi:hypothetical protein